MAAPVDIVRKGPNPPPPLPLEAEQAGADTVIELVPVNMAGRLAAFLSGLGFDVRVTRPRRSPPEVRRLVRTVTALNTNADALQATLATAIKQLKPRTDTTRVPNPYP